MEFGGLEEQGQFTEWDKAFKEGYRKGVYDCLFSITMINKQANEGLSKSSDIHESTKTNGLDE